GLGWKILGDPDAEGNRPQIAFSFDGKPRFTLPAGSYLAEVKKGSASTTKQVEVVAGELSTDQLVLGSGILVTQAIMSTGMPPHDSGGLGWKVLSEPDAEGNRKQVAFSFDNNPKLTVPAGTFRVEVKRGSAMATADVEVRPGEATEATLNLNASLLKPNAIMTEGADPVSGGGLAWKVLTEPDAEGNRRQIAASFDDVPTLILPVGRYLTQVKRGQAMAEAEVDVVAGTLNTMTIDLNAGIFDLSVVDGSGTAITANTRWTILGPEDAEGRRQRIGYSFDAAPRFILPGGPVQIEVKVGDETGTADATVTAGKLEKIAVQLD
ncbi:MAG: hypothetical protein AAGC68_13205, partial [Verrucomicrobiota bacterium]